MMKHLRRIRSCLLAALTVTMMSVAAAPAHAVLAQHDSGYRGNAGTAGLQKAVRALAKILRSSRIDKVLSFVRDAGKPDIARVIQKHAGTIANTLEAMAELDYLTVAFVRDNVMKALVASGVSRETARITGFWIEQVLTIVP
jgi:hypothetical protein